MLAKIGLKCFVNWTFQGLFWSSLVNVLYYSKTHLAVEAVRVLSFLLPVSWNSGWKSPKQPLYAPYTTGMKKQHCWLMASFSQLKRMHGHRAEMHLRWVAHFISSNVAHGICSIAYNALQQKIWVWLPYSVSPSVEKEKENLYLMLPWNISDIRHILNMTNRV